MTVNEAFDTFDDMLALPEEEREAATEFHHDIREVLQEAGVATGAILQGSFARKTMLPPLADVDLVVFLAPEYASLRDEPGGSEAAMDLIEDALAGAYPSAIFDRSSHALKVDFGDGGFTFDIVPGFDTDEARIWIADREDDRFELSDTRLVTLAVQARNQECGGKFIHQVRMVRHWFRRVLDGLVPRFVGECLAYEVITDEMAHDEAVAAVFAAAVKHVEEGVVLVPGSDENVLDRLDDSALQALRDHLREADRAAQEALDLAAAGDEEGAVDIWHQVFGDPFPEPPAQSVEDAFERAVGGGVTSSGRATATSVTRSPTPGGRGWQLQ